MKAGLLKEKITILSSKVVNSEYGENKTEWFSLYVTRAEVKYNSLNRSTVNDEIFFSTSIEFKIREYVEVKEWDRIRWQDKDYRILSIIPNKQNQDKTIITELINE